MRSESAQYTLLFLFDLFQFFMQFFVNLKQVKPEKAEPVKPTNKLQSYFNHDFEYRMPGSDKLIR